MENSSRKQNPVVSSRPNNPVVSSRNDNAVTNQEVAQNSTESKENMNVLGIVLVSVLVVAVVGFVAYKKFIKK